MMHEHQNRETLIRLSAGMQTIHIWLLLGYGWYVVLQTGFFGEGWISWLIAAAALIFLLSLGTLFIKEVLQTILRKMLTSQIVNGLGCMSGIGVFIGLGFLFLWALTRNLELAGWTFLLAPAASLAVALILTWLKPLFRNVRQRLRR